MWFKFSQDNLKVLETLKELIKLFEYLGHKLWDKSIYEEFYDELKTIIQSTDQSNLANELYMWTDKILPYIPGGEGTAFWTKYRDQFKNYTTVLNPSGGMFDSDGNDSIGDD